MIYEYLETIRRPMHRAKAKAALVTYIRLNGDACMLRHGLIERRVAAGAKVMDHKGEMVLMNPDESWLNARNITKHGLNYAAWLSVRSDAYTKSDKAWARKEGVIRER